MKILELANVDFSLRHFVLPLMRGLRARGHEVIGCAAEGPLLESIRAEGFRVVAIPFVRRLAPLAQMQAFGALLALLRQERFDIVHAHMPISGLLGRFAAKMAGVPRIAYTCHGFLFNQPGPWWRRHLALRLEQLAGRITDLYLTVSVADAEDARRLGIHPQPHVVFNGRNPALFRPDAQARAALRAELGAGEEHCVIVVVSRLVRAKGYPELLAAMEALPPHTVLWVVGERLPSDHGEDLEPYFARAAARLGPRLRRLGYRHDVARILAAADIFCLPSHSEAMPTSVIEAMLCGLPIVASDIRGPREQVENGRTGFLVPPMTVAPLAAALARLAADPALRRRLGEAARAAAVARFDETQIVARTVQLLEG